MVNLMTGPAQCQEDDEGMVTDFMADENAVKVVCGGTSANIAARVLKKEIVTSVNYADPSVPPTASIEGLDLVTEGVLTLGKALGILRKYEQDEFDEEFFNELDADNGASKLAKLLIEECTDLNLFVGKALNRRTRTPTFPLT